MQFLKQLFLASFIAACMTALILKGGTACIGTTDEASSQVTEKNSVEKNFDLVVTIIYTPPGMPESHSSWGTGILHTTRDGQVWVWTCGHVLTDFRTETPRGDGGTAVTFAPVRVRKTSNSTGEKLDINILADVIRYSDSEKGFDLGLLRLCERIPLTCNSKFYLESRPPVLSTDIVAFGTLNSSADVFATFGKMCNVSYQVPSLPTALFDVVDCAACGGWSGGPITLENDGRIIGITVRSNNTLTLMVPTRHMLTWARRVGVDFAMDDSLPIPNDDVLLSRNVDDSVE